MGVPIKVADLPVRVQNEIVAGTVQEEIADFEHRHCIRPRPASACAARPALPAALRAASGSGSGAPLLRLRPRLLRPRLPAPAPPPAAPAR